MYRTFSTEWILWKFQKVKISLLPAAGPPPPPGVSNSFCEGAGEDLFINFSQSKLVFSWGYQGLFIKDLRQKPILTVKYWFWTEKRIYLNQCLAF